MKEREPSNIIGIQPGVSPITREFLLEAYAEGAFDTLRVRSRNIIAVYFGTQATGPDLAAIYGVSDKRIQQILYEGISKLRKNLPEEIQAKYSQEQLILKRGQTPRMIEKYKRVATGRPSKRKGIPHTPEQNEKNRQASRAKWADKEWAERNRAAQRKARGEGKGPQGHTPESASKISKTLVETGIMKRERVRKSTPAKSTTKKEKKPALFPSARFKIAKILTETPFLTDRELIDATGLEAQEYHEAIRVLEDRKILKTVSIGGVRKLYV